MIRLISKTLLINSRINAPNKSSMAALSLLSIRYFSIDPNQHSFTVSYLMNSCGLSSESAQLVSKSVQFETPEKPDLILSFLKKLGFSKSDLSRMITIFPKMLLKHPQKTISPKFDFFRSNGVSDNDIVKIFTRYPWLLTTSLENQLVHSFNFLIELFQSLDKVIEVIKQCPRLLCNPPESYLAPNLNTLRENRVPAVNILRMVRSCGRFIVMNPVKFREVVEEAKEMGLSPMNSQFVGAFTALTISKSKRDRKVDVYKQWGWSNKDVSTAFVKYPWCMAISEDKLMAVMEFYVTKLGLETSVIVNNPLLLGLSLKKRLIPRGEVIQFLVSKGLVKLDSSVRSMFTCTEKCFLEKYVDCYEEAPHLIKLYNQKLNVSDAKQSAEVETAK